MTRELRRIDTTPPKKSSVITESRECPCCFSETIWVARIDWFIVYDVVDTILPYFLWDSLSERLKLEKCAEDIRRDMRVCLESSFPVDPSSTIVLHTEYLVESFFGILSCFLRIDSDTECFCERESDTIRECRSDRLFDTSIWILEERCYPLSNLWSVARRYTHLDARRTQIHIWKERLHHRMSKYRTGKELDRTKSLRYNRKSWKTDRAYDAIEKLGSLSKFEGIGNLH